MFIAEKRARISDNIAEQILRYAEENQIQVGEQLPSERQLARYFGVGRTSVREGLRRLEILGQVEIIPSKGVYLKEGAIGTIDKVLKLWLKRNERAIRELVELRVALETKTAHMAARRATQMQIEKMADQIEQMQFAADHDDADTFLDADNAFHDTIAEAAGNTLIRRTLASVSKEIVVYRMATAHLGKDALERSLADHRAIFEAIKARDPAAAWRSMHDHIILFPRDFHLLDQELDGDLGTVLDEG